MLCVRGELETEQTATYWPPVPLSLSALLSRSAGRLNRGSWRLIALCWVLVLSAASYLQLNEPLCGTGFYNSLASTRFLWASHLHPIQHVHSEGYTLISSTGFTCYLHKCISYLKARPRVNMLQYLLWLVFFFLIIVYSFNFVCLVSLLKMLAIVSSFYFTFHRNELRITEKDMKKTKLNKEQLQCLHWLFKTFFLFSYLCNHCGLEVNEFELRSRLSHSLSD